MPIKQLTPRSQIDDRLRSELSKREANIITKFCYVGEACLKAGRTSGSYTDRTGNLRNSIGYVVVKDGRVVQQATTEENKGTESGARGTARGEAFIKELAGRCGSGIHLIVAAGMDYSACVAARGYDVLDSAELLAADLVPKVMQKLGFIRK